MLLLNIFLGRKGLKPVTEIVRGFFIMVLMDISSVDCADKTVIEQSSAEIHALMDISKERDPRGP